MRGVPMSSIKKMVNKKVCFYLQYYLQYPNSNSILGTVFSFEIKWLAEKLWAKTLI